MKLEIRQPVKFGMNEAVIGNLLSTVPSLVLGALIALGFVIPPICLLFLLTRTTTPIIFILSVMFSAMCLMAGFILFYFFPLLLNVNYYIKFIAGRIVSPPPEGAHVCQISTTPKLCSGLRAVLEDADDIGYVTISADSVEFRGDSVDFSISGAEISNVGSCNVGWRGYWVAGRRIKLTINGHDRFKEIEISERHSWTIPGSRSLADQLHAQISSLLKQNP
ncbi:MAG TPA: hypothetical protein DET40_01625 [Lentisphaeria bacterium]|nr:MAG: hypothetical protein A2X45_17095 [Lentisphaerae bacterium GWF2_50_93]HCE42233.1 hypothetical protein [Lentisphaeria bacterium]